MGAHCVMERLVPADVWYPYGLDERDRNSVDHSHTCITKLMAAGLLVARRNLRVVVPIAALRVRRAILKDLATMPSAADEWYVEALRHLRKALG
jgi:hypothetical protein